MSQINDEGNGPTGFDVKFGDMTLTLVCGFRYSFFFFSSSLSSVLLLLAYTLSI